MRPRLLHLGSGTSRTCPRTWRFASMRPRLLHLGSGRPGGAQSGFLSRFNEAEAFTPRIPLDAQRTPRYARRFNEAEAFTPRIRLALVWASHDPLGFNEAEAFTPRIEAFHMEHITLHAWLQ